MLTSPAPACPVGGTHTLTHIMPPFIYLDVPTCVIEEALVVDVDLPKRPLAQSVGLGQDPLLEVVDEVSRPDALELLLELVAHVSPGLGHQEVLDAGLQAAMMQEFTRA